MYAIGEKNSGDVLFTGPAKDQRPGKKGDPIKPKFLLGDELKEPAVPSGFKEVKFESNKQPPPPTHSRKDQLADWVARADNPYFARAIANRVWAQYMGRGIVHPVDNLSPANAPSHPALLDALTQWMVDNKFDLKGFIREVVNSRAYQLSSGGSSGEAQPIHFQHARTRPLSAEELAESWRVATGYDGSGKKRRRDDEKGGRFRPLEAGYMIRFFGQPNNGVGDFQGGLSEHLYMNNGPLNSLIVSGPDSVLTVLLDREKPMDERIDKAFLQMLNRPPQKAEREKISEVLSAASGSKESEDHARDVIWALITCSEFRFNH